jgi:hypothetical protein
MVLGHSPFAVLETQMKKTIITFGLISGAVSSLMMLATVPFADRIGFDKGLVVGYTGIVLSFLLVFLGFVRTGIITATGRSRFPKLLLWGFPLR